MVVPLPPIHAYQLDEVTQYAYLDSKYTLLRYGLSELYALSKDICDRYMLNHHVNVIMFQNLMDYTMELSSEYFEFGDNQTLLRYLGALVIEYGSLSLITTWWISELFENVFERILYADSVEQST